MTIDTTSGRELEPIPGQEFDVAMSLIDTRLKEAMEAEHRNTDYNHYRDNFTTVGEAASVVRLVSFTLAASYEDAIRGSGDVFVINVPIKSIRLGEDLLFSIDDEHEFFILSKHEDDKEKTFVVDRNHYHEVFGSEHSPVENLIDKLVQYQVIPSKKPII